MQQLYGNLEDVGGVFTLTRACCEESVVTLKKCRDLADDEFQLMVKRMPVRGRAVFVYTVYSFSQWISHSTGFIQIQALI